MGIPIEFRCKNRDTCSGVDALCMLLFRLSRPRRYRELKAAFGGSGHRIGRLSNSLSVYLHNRYHRKLNSLDRGRLTDDYLISMARAQYAKNGVMPNIIGFIDATVRPCCRFCFCTPLFSKFSPYFLIAGLFTFSRKFTTARIVSMLSNFKQLCWPMASSRMYQDLGVVGVTIRTFFVSLGYLTRSLTCRGCQ